MNNLLLNYQDDILFLFKEHYRRLITKSSQVSFDEILIHTLKELNITRGSAEDTRYLEEWFNRIHHQSFLNDLIKDPFLEILFHSSNRCQVITFNERTDREINSLSKDEFQLSLEVMALKQNITWNFNEPFSSFMFSKNGLQMRATLVHASTSAESQSKLFLRKIQGDHPTLDLFQLDPHILETVADLVRQKKNVLISGGTGSGKTTFLRSLVQLIPHEEHLVVLEDTHEILKQHPGQTAFLAVKDQPGKTLKDYCAYSLRMSPDRIVVGEMRSTEVVPFLLAMNTGHKGLMSTIHASSGVDALNRIALLFTLFSESADLSYSLVMKLVCKNIDYVVHMENKRVKEICRVIGSENETPFYERIF